MPLRRMKKRGASRHRASIFTNDADYSLPLPPLPPVPVVPRPVPFVFMLPVEFGIAVGFDFIGAGARAP